MTTEEIKKRLNFSRVLRAIWLNKGISRVEIAKNIRVDKSTVSNIVSVLLNMGIVLETEEGEAGPQGGRKPIFLTVNENFGYFVGFEIQNDYFRAIVVDLDGKIVLKDSGPLSVNSANVVPEILRQYRRIKKELDSRSIPILGVCIGCPGVINPLKGQIRYSVLLEIMEPLNIVEQLSKEIDVPVFLENDANCCSWGELSYNKTLRLRNFIFVMGTYHKQLIEKSYQYSIGVGLGIVINGKVHHGLDFSGGEFRSVFWKDSSKSQFSSLSDPMQGVFANKEMLIEQAGELSKNVALLVNTLNLSHVFLGGFISSYKDDIIKVFEQAIEYNWPYPNKPICSVKLCSLGNEAVAYGSAAMLMERLFAIPEIPETSEKNIKKRFALIERIHELAELDKNDDDE